MSMNERRIGAASGTSGGALDVERDSDVPISTQIYWQLAYQIDSGRLLPGARLPPVRELGAALRVNPNTIRAVYRRLADAGYVTSRHGAGTHVADRPPQRRGAEALAGIVSEMLRRAAHAGFTADEVAAATFAAATERKRPGPLVRVLFAECTNADAGYDAERLVDEFPGLIEAEGALLDDLPDRLERFHYDLVATTTFHADEAQALVAGRVPVVAMLVGPAYVELVHEIAGPADRLAGRARVRLGARHGQHPRDARAVGDDRRRDRRRADRRARRPRARRPDRRPDPDVARGAGGRPRRDLLAPRADPAVDVRVRSVRAGAAPPGDRARRRGRARPRSPAPDRPPSGACAMTARRPCDASSMRDVRSFHVRREPRERYAIDGPLIGVRRRPRRRRHRRASAGWPAG